LYFGNVPRAAVKSTNMIVSVTIIIVVRDTPVVDAALLIVLFTVVILTGLSHKRDYGRKASAEGITDNQNYDQRDNMLHFQISLTM